MNNIVSFWIVFVLLLALIIFFDLKYGMLRDTSTGYPKPYSYARVQLAWWTLIVLSCFIAITIAKGVMPVLNTSTLVLLGITAGTTIVARVIDVSDQTKGGDLLSRNYNGEGFFLDILSDKDGVSIHRFQAVIINIVFGVWFVWMVLHQYIIPVIGDNNLVLLGLSSGIYAALKTTENKIV